MRHTRLWTYLAIALLMVGNVSAALLLPSPALLLTFAAVATTTRLIQIGIRSGASSRVTETNDVKAVTRHMALGGASATALCGLLAWLGGFGLLLAVAIALWSPPVVRLLVKLPVTPRRDTAIVSTPERPPEAVEPEPQPRPRPNGAPSEFGDLSTEQVCRRWCRSYADLQGTETCAQRQQIIELRKALLDELERRNPQGLRQWLDSGARAAGDPTRYVSDHHD